ncbi:MAG: hypothetical protein HPAVJP_0050 [Candidatus Hepatoplasma vulgare]|nr:MAG: hypothetical protein HPAVJP_0050 [Candidatus Hepatoplasma sp.]
MLNLFVNIYFSSLKDFLAHDLIKILFIFENFSKELGIKSSISSSLKISVKSISSFLQKSRSIFN